MAEEKPVSMLVLYRVKPGQEAEFIPLLKRHWPALRSVDLATATPVRIYRGESKRPADGNAIYVETFEWKNANAAGIAHQTPEVMSVWEPMTPMLAGMELIALHPVEP